MNIEMQSKIEKLRADFAQINGRPFNHFFCPILFKDKDSNLCKAHIINQAFPNSSRKWTIQRTDVDQFYGSNFEADFFSLKYPGLGKAFTDKTYYKRFSPKILINDQKVEYFVAHNKVPKQYTPLVFEDDDGQTILLGLQMSPEEFKSLQVNKLEMEINKDVRVPALVSLIKSAHLTMFELLGYRYALSAGGHFVGWDILGKFYTENREQPKARVLEQAKPYFREFVHMVRPLLEKTIDVKGTITDGIAFLCKYRDNPPWAMIIFVEISNVLHAVMLPLLNHADNAGRFYNFLRNSNEKIEGSLCKFVQDHWELNTKVTQIVWPKDGTLYPELE